VAYWCVARLENSHNALALHCLALRGYSTYYPHINERRIRHGRRVAVRVPLFINYTFAQLDLQWHAARWSPGVSNLLMADGVPARVPDNVIAEIRSRECNGLVVLPRRELARGDRVRVIQGPLLGLEGLYDGLRGHEWVAVLLAVLGRVILPADDVEALANANGREH
jgi:transcription antitermination factor NusG